MTRGRSWPAALLLLSLAGSSAAAEDLLLTGSFRGDFLYFLDVPEGLDGVVAEDATNLDGWFDLRGFYGDFEASARLRVHQSSGITDDSNDAFVDRRHLAYRRNGIDLRAGHYYQTLGNGLLLRTLEQRFVTLNRVDRPFNLDRNLDGVRVRSEAGPLRVTGLSGRPQGQEVSATGGAETLLTDDLLQGGDATFDVLGHGEVGVAYLLADLESTSNPDQRRYQDLASYRGATWVGNWRGEFEYAERRPRDPILADGFGRYARLAGAQGVLGLSLEWKNYWNFAFPYNQLPTLVRTQESVLLNRSTHVLIPSDERGWQAEAVISPDYVTQVLANFSGSDDRDQSPDRVYREVYLEGRSEIEELGAGRLGLDWTRDRIKGVEDQWTAALELESFLGESSVILDFELQTREVRLGATQRDVTNQLLQLAYSMSGRWTLAVTGEHTNDPTLDRNDWLFVSLDARLSSRHDVTLGVGRRPAGLVCSGGFCFESPAFEGVEARILSRF